MKKVIGGTVWFSSKEFIFVIGSDSIIYQVRRNKEKINDGEIVWVIYLIKDTKLRCLNLIKAQDHPLEPEV